MWQPPLNIAFRPQGENMANATRAKVTVRATELSLQLRTPDGEMFEYLPMEIVTIDNSFGGYLVAPINNNPHIWGWWRIGHRRIVRLRSLLGYPTVKVATDKGSPLTDGYTQLAKEIMLGKPERAVFHRRQYLFARTSGAARRGVMHTYRPEKDPIRQALEIVGCDSNTGRIVRLNEAIGMWTNPTGLAQSAQSQRVWLASDGGYTTARGLVSSDPQEFYADVVIGITDTTAYMIRFSEGLPGSGSPQEITVAVTTTANRQTVADAIIKLVSEHTQPTDPSA